MMLELLQLARKALETQFNEEELVIPENVKKKYSVQKASFVTLTENSELRGCIGSLYPRQELYKDVIENAINAGFNDSRFAQLRESELEGIKIEVSVLSIPEKLEFKDDKDLLKKIDKDMGILLRKGFYSATFLPQVWEDIPDKKDFLEHLSRKAGLEKDAWKTANIFFYRVEKIKER